MPGAHSAEAFAPETGSDVKICLRIGESIKTEFEREWSPYVCRHVEAIRLDRKKRRKSD